MAHVGFEGGDEHAVSQPWYALRSALEASDETAEAFATPLDDLMELVDGRGWKTRHKILRRSGRTPDLVVLR